MRNNNAPTFAAGFMAGLIVGAFLASALLARETAERLERERERLKIPIIVAASDIREGDRIQSAHFRTKGIDRRAYIDWTMTSGEENGYIGYTAAMDIQEGTPILKGALYLEPGRTLYNPGPY